MRGAETQRMHQHRIDSGFYDKWMQGNGLDIGFRGSLVDAQPVLDGAIGVDSDYLGYNGIVLPFNDNSQDYVYSSHCLEHIDDYKSTLKEWYRVTKIGGYIVIAVPHQDLYERKDKLPSRFNEDHKRFYRPSNLLKEVEDSLIKNTYRIRLLEDGDAGFNYNIPDDVHAVGQYEILLVLEKING